MKLITNEKDFFDEVNIQQFSFVSPEEIEIRNYRFDCGLQFGGVSEFLDQVRFVDCEFLDYCFFEGNHFKNILHLQNCSFKNLRIGSSSFRDEVRIENCIFQDKFQLVDSTFYEDVYFVQNDFQKGCNIFEKRDGFGAVEFKKALILQKHGENN